MAQLNVKIPSVQQSFYDTTGAKANKDKIVNVIRPKFGTFINNSSAMSGVPSELIESIIFIESAGNPNAASPYAVGLMQVGFATASDALVKEKGAGRMSDEEAKIIKAKLGDRWSLLENVKPHQTTIGKTFITKADLLDPEFNITVGVILLKQLIDEFTGADGKVRMDKVVVIYNGGRYGAIAKKTIAFKGTTEELLAEMPKETSAYILKLIGTQGLLDTMLA